MYKTFLFLTAILFLPACSTKENNDGKPTAHISPAHDYPIKPVAFTQVTINDCFWSPRIETNRQVTIPYTFKKSEETGRISNFAKAGGLEDGEFQGIFFNDSDVFKIIEGASYALQVENDPELKEYVDDLIAKIAHALAHFPSDQQKTLPA